MAILCNFKPNECEKSSYYRGVVASSSNWRSWFEILLHSYFHTSLNQQLPHNYKGEKNAN